MTRLTLALLVTAFIIFLPVSAKAKTLRILSWSEYIDPELVKEFEKKHRVKIKFRYFEDDDDRDAILVKSNGRGYDLVIVNGIQVKAYQRRGWISKIDQQQVPNSRFIDRKWKSAFAQTRDYGLPYFWGTTGIAYRKDLIQDKITSWRQLFNPTKAMQGKIVMLGVGRDVIGMALKSLGYQANSTDISALEQVRTLLEAQKPYVKTYSYMTLDKNSPLVTGEAVIAMAFSGDAMMVKEHNENIEYVVPEEGGNIWVDYHVVLAASRNKSLAYDFLDFINEPENAARNASFVYYATPNNAAKKHLSKDFLSDPVIYPPGTQLEKSEFDGELPGRIIKKRNQIMANLRNR